MRRPGHRGPVLALAVSGDGSRFVSASADGSTRVWRADSGGEPVVLEGHEGPVRCVAFNPDGSRIVTGSEDGTARVWRLDGTDEPLILKGHGSMVFQAAFSPDGTRLLTAGGKAPRLRRVTWPALLEYLREKTRVCLTPEQRIQYLVETPDEARRAHAKCERRLGRTATTL